MSGSSSVLIVTQRPDVQERVSRVLAGLDVEAVSLTTVEQATTALTETHPLFVILWPDEITAALRQPWRMLKAFAAEARAALVAVGPPLLGNAEEALACGADEYLPDVDLESSLGLRVSALRDGMVVARSPPFRPRTVLLADPDALWRLRMGGLLESAGYHVLYAGHLLELQEALQGMRGPLPEVCVMDPFAPELGRLDAIRELRAQPAGRKVPVLLVSAVARDPALLEALQALDVHDLLDKSSTGFEAIVPLIEDQVSLAARRRAPRVSFLALCRFRDPALGHWDHGLVYNLSSTGVFIRTLAPLPRGASAELELELNPGAGQAQLAAKVAWANPFQAASMGRPPPGMGLALHELSQDVRVRLEARIWPTTGETPRVDREPPLA